MKIDLSKSLVALVLSCAAWAQTPFQSLDQAWGKPIGGESVKGGLKGYLAEKAVRKENGQEVYYYRVTNPNDQPVKILFNPTAGLNVKVEFLGGPNHGQHYDRNPGTKGVGYLKTVPAEYDLGPRDKFVMRIAANGKWTYFPARGHVYWTKLSEKAKAVAAAPKVFELVTQKGETVKVSGAIPNEFLGDYEYQHSVYGYKFRLQKEGTNYFWPQTLKDLRSPSAGAFYDPSKREDLTRWGLQVDESGKFVTYEKNIKFGVDVNAMKLYYESSGKVWVTGLYTLEGKQYIGDAAKLAP